MSVIWKFKWQMYWILTEKKKKRSEVHVLFPGLPYYFQAAKASVESTSLQFVYATTVLKFVGASNLRRDHGWSWPKISESQLLHVSFNRFKFVIISSVTVIMTLPMTCVLNPPKIFGRASCTTKVNWSLSEPRPLPAYRTPERWKVTLECMLMVGFSSV